MKTKMHGARSGSGLLALLVGAGLAAPTQVQAQIEEIVVTATKREERLSRVPIAVTAVTGDQLQESHITNFDSLASTVPGPVFVPVSGSSGSQVSIRGLAASDDSPAFESPVGVFIDDLYYGSTASFNPDFYDVDQIAILRGPQGTTFGRNTVGGALQVVSNKPNFDGLSGEISLTANSFPGFESEGFINATLSEKLAGRLSFSVKKNEGYQHNVTTGEDLADKNVWSTRGQLLFRPTDSLSILTSFSYTRENSLGDGPVLIGQGALIASLQAQSTDWHDTFVDDDGKTDRDIYTGFIRADWDLDSGTLTSITGYRKLDAYYREDIDGSPLRINPDKYDRNKEEQFSQELRFASPSGRTIEWIAGLYFLKQKIFRSETYNFGGTAYPNLVTSLTGGAVQNVTISGDIDVTSFAPYAEAKWNITDKWALTGGLRYTFDHKDNTTIHSAPSVFFGAAKNVSASEQWGAFTPRGILEYKPAEGVLIYGSVSKGFKSGGFNYAAPTLAQAITPLRPERNMTLEFGTKAKFFRDRLAINLAAYKSNTRNLQVRSLVGTTLQSSNAGEAEAKGVEIEVQGRPLENLDLGVSYAYTHAKYARFVGCAAGGLNCTGDFLPFTPKNVISVFAQYKWDLGDVGALTMRVENRRASSYEMFPPSVNTRAIRELTARKDWLNAFLSYEPLDGQWEVRAWGRNLLDKEALAFGTNYGFYLLTTAESAAGLTQAYRTTVTEPRSFGFTFTYRLN